MKITLAASSWLQAAGLAFFCFLTAYISIVLLRLHYRIQTLIDSKHTIVHNKIMVIDGKMMITGYLAKELRHPGEGRNTWSGQRHSNLRWPLISKMEQNESEDLDV